MWLGHRRISTGLALALVLALIVVVSRPAVAGQRVALVIGNAAYAGAPLANPVNDARDMAAKLRSVGFEVILRENTAKSELEAAIGEFGQRLQPGAVALLFYSGHGMQVGGRNFLIPVDAKIQAESQVRLQTVDVDVVLDQMAAAASRVNLLILDACRNNPFERRFRGGGGGGLAQINAPEGTLIAYATAPGKVASDGEGRNGLYTAELLKAIDQPGDAIEDIFKRVRVSVSRASGGSQTPWESSSLTGDFYFRGEGAPAAAGAAAPTAPAVDKEALFWESIKDGRNAAAYRAYLDQYPDGSFAALAQLRLSEITGQSPRGTAQTAAAVPPPAPEPAAAAGAAPPPPPPFPAEAALAELDSGNAPAPDAPPADGRPAAPFRRFQNAARHDPTAFVARLRREAERGRPRAQAMLGRLNETGHGIPRDYAEAAAWYRKAAVQGDPLGQVGLGNLYRTGHGVAPDDREAVKWFRLAAEQGNAMGETALAFMMLGGHGVARDPAEAVRWFTRAANQGNPFAEAALGWAYQHGVGVAADADRAQSWYRAAARHGSAFARHSLQPSEPR
ncbi:MAG: hypothetical protein GC191_07090 [Azospirillum sp.]|nr:hypothetical protein [Azospirillum sp.]